MKKAVLTLALVAAVTQGAWSQLNLGARLNAGWGVGSELSLHYLMGKANRLEADFGINWWQRGHYNHTYTVATAAYHWTFPIIEGFSWFVGPGGQVGIHHESYSYKHETDNSTYLRIAAIGQVGIEYNFDFPLQLTLDVRPGIDLLHFSDPFLYSFAAGARYRF